MILLNPYLSFREDARPAMEFYRSVFGGELTLNTFADGGMPDVEPSDEDKVMHATLEGPDGLVLMASDVPSEMGDPSANGTMSLSGDDEDRLRGWWEQLSADGRVNAPLERAPWGDLFGMCTDKFGVNWMVDITPPQG